MTVEPRRYRLRHRTRPIDVWMAGEGRPIVLLHGWGLSGAAYRGAVRALAASGRRAIAPSIAVAERWSIEDAAELVAECLAGVDAAPAPIAGHSFGGAVGAQLAIAHRDFVTALVPINAPLVTLGNMRLGRIVLPGRHYRIVGHGPAAAALVSAAVARGGLRSLARSARWFLGNGHGEKLKLLVDSGVPCAVLWAENDSLLPVEVGRRSAQVLACELHVVGDGDGWPGARPPDHDWPFREPEFFASSLLTVLEHLGA